MKRFIITKKSGNKLTGSILVTTSPRETCPSACPFRKGSGGPEASLCYAEHGHLGHHIWTGLDRAAPGDRIGGRIPVYDLAGLVEAIRSLPEGAIWRHNQAGDLPSTDNETIDAAQVEVLVNANHGRRGFTYTHFDVLDHEPNQRVVRDANKRGFTINLSADTLAEADALAALDCAPVTVVVPADQTATRTPAGRVVVVCPARTRPGVTCSTCRLCAIPTRRTIIAFPALGAARDRKLAH